MTNWEKLKVTELKEELKSRGVPLTGLKVKQQFIDKLNELDSESGATEQTTGEQPDEAIVDAPQDGVQDEDDTIQEGSRQSLEPEEPRHHESVNIAANNENQSIAHTPEDETSIASSIQVESEQVENSHQSEQSANDLTGDDRVEKLPDDLPAELKKEESHARDGTTPPPVEVESASKDEVAQPDVLFVPQEESGSEDGSPMVVDSVKGGEIPEESHESKEQQNAHDPMEIGGRNGDDESITEATASTHVPTPELLDDQRKRKRRSLTPAPQDDVHKKTKLNDSTPISTRRESDILRKVQAATDAVQAVRSMSDVHNDIAMGTIEQMDDKKRSVKTLTRSPNVEDIEQVQEAPTRKMSPPLSRSSPDRDVTPAMHPATQSIYIRNFKRPLHIPSLRSHITSLVGSSEDDPLRVFYLDSIRTHAFISFKSISAASRVRNAMHGTRFPNEPMREPLWIDFVPDEKVQTWIDHETDGGGSGSFGGGRGSAKKYEVVYSDSREGISAKHQEISGNSMQLQRAGFSQSRSNRAVPQDQTLAAAASGVHPSRASLVPLSPSAPRVQHQQSQPQRPPVVSDQGKGFRALDELFSSTTAKPKLYYKLPPQSVIDDRSDMMRDLRVGHDQMGKSGDEGMKRYSFEKDDRNGREDWVDKGPEFGFGRRGQERLTGYGNTYGGARGRGGFRGARRGGDSWRGR